MSAVNATTSFRPTSFQLKLALGSRSSRLAFSRLAFPEVHRRNVNFVSLVVKSSAVNDKGVEQRASDKSSWTNLHSSGDEFAGWANTDSELQSTDSKKKGPLVGMLGAGVAGFVIIAGLTFAAVSVGNRRTSRVKEHMEPLTTQQENSFSSDENQHQFEEEKDEEKVATLESANEESGTGTNEDPSLHIENTETNENRPSDDDGVRKSSENVYGYIPNSIQREPAITQSLVSPEVSDEPPISDASHDSNAFPSSNNNLAPQNPNGVSKLNESEKPNFSPVPSAIEPSVSDLNIKIDTVVVASTLLQTEAIDSGDVLSLTDFERKEVLSDVEFSQGETVEASIDEDDKSPLEQTSSEKIPTGVHFIQEVLYHSPDQRLEDDYNDTTTAKSFFDSTNPGNFSLSAGIPAPSIVSAALQAHPGRVLVPPVIDQLQSQALSALQVLKVIEEDVQPGDLCTRREYARWLVVASSALSRNTSSKVYPAMYIENVSELAFDDITPEDPDFPSIQGLAEAGLIASKLSRRDMLQNDDEDLTPIYFSPGSPLSRQDLVTWRMALEKRHLPVVDKKTIQQLSGFIDIDKIDPDAWPALVADLAAEEQGIVTLAFGYTRLFQPQKPVTKAQAAIAIATGDASAIVSEELARIEAESMAENAVAAHSALVAEVENDLNESYEKELYMEREKINAVEKLAEEATREVEKLRAAREEENLSLMKERAAVDSEMEVLSRLRREVEEKLQNLMADKLEISYEKERLNKLRRDAESENHEITRLQYELEVERKALSMARSWAEDEAKRAREQAKALDEARNRWERRGLKVVVDKDLSDEADAGVTWLATGEQLSVEETIERSETLVSRLKHMANEVRSKAKDTITSIVEVILLFISNLKKRVLELKDAAKSRWNNSLQDVQHRSAPFTSAVKEGTKRFAGDWKEGVERLSQRFKIKT